MVLCNLHEYLKWEGGQAIDQSDARRTGMDVHKGDLVGEYLLRLIFSLQMILIPSESSLISLAYYAQYLKIDFG